MTTRLFPLLLLAILPLAATRPVDSAWRLVETTDDLTGATDRRLILRADDWRNPSGVPADNRPGATLVLACGDRIPSVEGKSLFFFAGQPLEPFGNEQAYAELRFDDQPRPLKTFLTILDYGDAFMTPTGRRVSREVAFLGTDQSPYFSRPLFDRLLAAGKLTVTYRAFGEIRTVIFHLVGLREALPQLQGCRWTS
jgi:hypothetical protein